MIETRINNWDGSTLPMPHMARLFSKDLDEVHDHMERYFCPHRLRIEGGAPPIRFQHNHALLKDVSFNATEYGNPYGRVVVDVPPNNEMFLIQFSLSGTAMIFHEKEEFALRPGELCVLNPGARVRETFEKGYKHFTIKLPRSSIDAIMNQELGYAPSDLEFVTGAIRLDGEAAAFTQMARTICDSIHGDSSPFGHVRTVGAVEETLQRLFLAAVPHNHSDEFDSANSIAAPYYVCRVEAFIRDNITDPITLDKMIDVSGVSARSLHAGFRRFRNTTPMNYVKACRLALAHRMLSGAAETGQSVTEVALDCGFTHLSKFAHDYRERFGERPSDTLRFSGVSH